MMSLATEELAKTSRMTRPNQHSPLSSEDSGVSGSVYNLQLEDSVYNPGRAGMAVQISNPDQMTDTKAWQSCQIRRLPAQNNTFLNKEICKVIKQSCWLPETSACLPQPDQSSPLVKIHPRPCWPVKREVKQEPQSPPPIMDFSLVKKTETLTLCPSTTRSSLLPPKLRFKSRNPSPR